MNTAGTNYSMIMGNATEPIRILMCVYTCRIYISSGSKVSVIGTKYLHSRVLRILEKDQHLEKTEHSIRYENGAEVLFYTVPVCRCISGRAIVCALEEVSAKLAKEVLYPLNHTGSAVFIFCNKYNCPED